MLDWLIREGSIVLSWWFLVTLAGAAALPVCLRLFGGLPDRGYTLTRAAGLLLVTFVYWLLANVGFLLNTPGSIIFAWLLVLGGGLALVFRRGQLLDWRVWWRENRPVVVVGEILFLVLLFGWAIYRAHQNNLTGTEKPMELMFMSGIQRSVSFPPHDPWMSGYAISYYYFGYVMSAALSMLSGIPSTLGFNMTAALWFALTGLTSFGVAYNLVRSRAFDAATNAVNRASQASALLAGLLGMFLVVLMGNFQMPLVEMPYQTNTASESYLRYWNIDERLVPRGVSGSVGLDPKDWDFWWWFRAARILNDLNLNGDPIEVIDEFPQFSFLLADNHPHVLALPFVMLALGMALNLLLTGREPTRPETLFYALCLGGLAFLNTWDGPIYLLVLVGADGVRRLLRSGSLSASDFIRLLGFGVTLFVVGIVLYLPFWLGFRSQASGILPNFINPTLPQQFFLMFAPFLFLLAPFLLVELWRGRERANWGTGALAALGVLAGVFLLTLLLVALASIAPGLRREVMNFVDAAGGWSVVMPVIVSRRVESALTTLGLLVGIALVVARLFPRSANKWEFDVTADDRDAVGYPAATGFALLLVAAGLVLVLAPEFVYLRDNFGTRMNTIFKFYYQGWLLFSIASAYAIYTVLADAHLPLPSSAVRALISVLTAVTLMLGLLYPVWGIYTRMFVESGRLNPANARPLTLDGGLSFLGSLDDYESIMCFNDLVQGDDIVVAEAVGPAYRSEFGRVAALSGVSIVLGWENHEGQWRGSSYGEIAGTRASDIPALYRAPRWDDVRRIIDQYGIDYIFYGASERNAYGAAGEEKFRDRLEIVCERGSSRFYRVDQSALTANNTAG